MKSARLTYHRRYPQIPTRYRVGEQFLDARSARVFTGYWPLPPQFRPRAVPRPRPLWCVLEVEFDGIFLSFVIPQELDHFLDVMSQNPLPSGHALVPGQAVGRPKRHWLARLPSRAKPWKFRQRLCRHLGTLPEAAAFRRFYRDHPVRFDFPDHLNASPKPRRSRD